MMRRRNEHGEAQSGGIGFVGLLTIAFIVLKLCDVIDWPWIWVLSPLWISLAVGLAVALVFVVIGGIVAVFRRRR